MARRFPVVFLWVWVAWGGLVTHASMAQSVPVVTSLVRASSAVLNPGTKVVYEVTVRAGVSRVTAVSLLLQDARGYKTAFAGGMMIAPGSSQMVLLELQVEATWPNGEYRIQILSVSDNDGRQVFYRLGGEVETQPAGEAAGLGRHTLGLESKGFSVVAGDAIVRMPELIGIRRTSAPVLRPGDVLGLALDIRPGANPLRQILVAMEDPAGHARNIPFEQNLDPSLEVTRVTPSWINGVHRVTWITLYDSAYRAARYDQSGGLFFTPNEAGVALTHDLQFAVLEFEVKGGVDRYVPYAVGQVRRLTPATAYVGDPVTFGIGLGVGTGLLTDVQLVMENEHGWMFSMPATSTTPDATGEVRVELRPDSSWGRGRYRVRSISILPDVGPGITYQRNGTIATNPSDPVSTHVLNLPASDFDLVDRPVPPRITAFPSGEQALALGENAVFTVTATGAGPFTYQWRKDGQPIAGAVSPTLTLTDFRASQAGAYDVVVSNLGGSTPAAPALNLVVANPSIVRQPWSTPAVDSHVIGLNVGAAGVSLTYEWYEGLSGDRSFPIATTRFPWTQVLPSTQTRSYWVRITNFAGVVSSDTVQVPPAARFISRQPTAWTTGAGNVALYSFRISILGEVGFLNVQVQKNGVDVTSRFVEVERTVARVIENQRPYTEVDFRFQMDSLSAADAGSYVFVVRLERGGDPVLISQPAMLVLTSAGVPRIVTEPASQRVRRSGVVTLAVQAVGSSPLSYQWRRNRVQISGATEATLTLSGADELTTGQYDVIVSATGGAVVSATATVALNTDVARLSNLSVRAVVLGRSRPLIAGLVVRDPLGRGLPLVIRGVGPALGLFGVSSALSDPEVVSYASSGARLAENNDWGGGATLTAAFNRVGAFSFAEATSRDAALLQTSGAGAFTTHLNNRVEEAGAGMIEVYDASDPRDWEDERSPRLVNLSARVQLATGQTLIAGIAAGGNRPLRLLVRAAGPALRRFGVTQAMEDPRLSVYRADGTLLAANDDWELGSSGAEVAAAARASGAFAYDPGSRDAALLIDLPPGAATLHLTGAPGEALIEVYVIE